MGRVEAAVLGAESTLESSNASLNGLGGLSPGVDAPGIFACFWVKVLVLTS